MHSRIETTSCPDGAGITNRAGVLACKEVAGATNANGLPEGNYLDSCQGCAVTGGTLTCAKCSNGSGKETASSLALDSCDLATISNAMGQLTCVWLADKRRLAEEASGESSPPSSSAPDSSRKALDEVAQQRGQAQASHDEL